MVMFSVVYLRVSVRPSVCLQCSINLESLDLETKKFIGMQRFIQDFISRHYIELFHLIW